MKSVFEDETNLEKLRASSKYFCHPCLILKYCPYGVLVEDFPVIPITKKEDQEHQIVLLNILKSGRLPGGRRLTQARRNAIQELAKNYYPDQCPEVVPRIFNKAGCSIYGHLCPVYFVGSLLSESSERPKHGRSIPFALKARIMRRDNYTCRICHKHLSDEECEFDHKIALSSGGQTDENNLRLTCRSCNRAKGAKREAGPGVPGPEK